MTKKQSLLLLIRISTDMLLLSLAWCLAYYIRFYTWIAAPKGIPEIHHYYKLLPFICVIWLAILAAAGFYKRTGRHRTAFVEGLDIVQVCFFATIAFVSFSYFYQEYRYSRGLILIFFFLHIGAIIAGRSAIRKALRRYRRNSDPRKVLIFAYDG
ncbi:hypothetical protein N9D31_03725, partial [Oligoflexaceae bacterium]|nr:hypothetical protein [Oligoflexaceae bacterium]